MLRRIIISFILLVSLCALFAPLTFTGPNNDLTTSTAFAQDGEGDSKSTPPSSSPDFQEMMNDTVKILNLAMAFLERLLWPVLLLIGGLLKNDILFGAGMEEMMLNIWRNIRNIVNILFVLILLGIAFYNVMGGSTQEYHIKTILPKFIIALIAVNFSFLAVKVVIDGVSVVTTAFFALPSAVEQQLKEKDPEKKLKFGESETLKQAVCTGLYGTGDDYKPPDDKTALCKSNPKLPYEFTDDGKLFFSSFDSNNAAIILATNFGKVGEIKKVTLRGPGSAVKDLFLNSLFSATLYIIYATAFIALLIILAVRLIVLWVTMVLSPLIVLSFIIPDNLKSSLGGSGELGKKFVKNAIAPIPIALVMSIGFIMITAWKDARFLGGSLASETAGLNLLTSGMSTLQDLVAAIGMVVVIWLGVFEAAKDTYAQGMVEGLGNAVKQAGKFVVTAPFKYLPLIPVKAGEKPVSVGAITGALGQIPQQFRERQAKEEKRVLRSLGFHGGSIEDEIKESKNPEDFVKTTANGYRGGWDERSQKAITEKLKKADFRNKFFQHIPTTIEVKGEKYTRQKIEKMLKESNLPTEVAERIAQIQKDKVGVKTPTAAAKPGEAAPGTTPPGTAPPPGSDNAAQYGLKPADRAKYEALLAASGTDAASQKVREEGQEAKDKHDKIDEVVRKYQSEIGNAERKPENYERIVTEHRAKIIKQLDDNGIKDKDEQERRANALMKGLVSQAAGSLAGDAKTAFENSDIIKKILGTTEATPPAPGTPPK